ncbi:uncharacterized protein LOC130015183 [Mercurialis annua]|uniref:uncharacterized protein LOC130015183 n=1 Tax=Mercurialis annua TaxID=3986 RepID=UPI0024AE46AC|nr:uncharacterized protein LOC130015183 [Mercurialis annua]
MSRILSYVQKNLSPNQNMLKYQRFAYQKPDSRKVQGIWEAGEGSSCQDKALNTREDFFFNEFGVPVSMTPSKEFVINVHESDLPTLLLDSFASTQPSTDLDSESESVFNSTSCKLGNKNSVLSLRSPSSSSDHRVNNPDATIPNPDMSLITLRKKFLKPIISREDSPLDNIIPLSDNHVTGSNRSHVEETPIIAEKTEAQKTWDVGFQLGLFNKDPEKDSVELLSQNIAKEQQANC